MPSARSPALGDRRVKVVLSKAGRERQVGCPANEGDFLEQFEDRRSDQVEDWQEVFKWRTG